MPELPDITVYLEALDRRVRDQTIERVRLASPFVVRTFDPPIAAAQGRRVRGLRRMGKRIVLALDGDLFLVLHLMIAGRLRWLEAGAKIPGRLGLAALDFPSGTLLLTEASTKKRASLHLVRGEEGLAPFERGGLEVLDADLPAFREALRRESHTLKRALTDPTLFSGIGNAYSDEILHRARLSPVQLTRNLSEEELGRLFTATRSTLMEWTDRLRAEVGTGFPEKVTAFREEMAVHGRYRKPCPVCESPVLRIAYAENETNYCARCQTGGKVLSDRSLARLLKDDWPKSIDELEERLSTRPR
ncbi:MAG: formamidopyrimidine-DNA glycosylase [Deltaproteobacteria bacterium]|nr:formamidopyrimidine-DNA glycosylase [Deltaproteobacteria bacterium]